MRHGYYSGEHGVTIDLMSYAREIKFAIITRIEVHRKFRGCGYASAMMEQVLEDADEEGVMLALSIESDGTGLNDVQLRAWYERMGFMSRPEKLEGDTVMIRPPRGYQGDPWSLETFQPPDLRIV